MTAFAFKHYKHTFTLYGVLRSGPTMAKPRRGGWDGGVSLVVEACVFFSASPPALVSWGPFVCEVLEVINICFPSSVGEENPANPLWPLLNPQQVEPVSPFSSSSFGLCLGGCRPATNVWVGCGNHSGPTLFNAHLEFRAEPWQQVSLREGVCEFLFAVSLFFLHL